MSKQQRVLSTGEAVRDGGWWLRSAAYGLVLISALLPPAFEPGRPAAVMALQVALIAALAVALWHRDRHPWPAALLSLVAGGLIAEPLVAPGVAVAASRARRVVTPVFALAGAAVALAPLPRLAPSPIRITAGNGAAPPAADWTRAGVVVAVFVVVPALAGAVRRASRLAERQRLAVEEARRETAVERAAFDERARIAQEMHDVLGHKLAQLTMQAGALTVTAHAGGDSVERQAEAIRSTARDALGELRGLLGVLGTSGPAPLHPQPGLAETRELVAQSRTSGVPIVFVDDWQGLALPPALATTVYRVVAEALTNASRHARGAGVRVGLLRESPTSLLVEVGNEAAPRREDTSGTGLGLPGLSARLEAVGGRLEAGPTPQGGFLVAAHLPFSTSPEAIP